MKRLVFTLCVLGIGAAAWTYFRGAAYEASAGDPIPTSRVARRDLVVSTVALGTVEPMVGAEVEVGSRLSGVLEKLHVSIGDEVGRGDLLAELDDAEWRARVAGLEAEAAQAEARLDYAIARRRALEAVDETSALERASARMEAAVLEAAVDRVRARLSEARIQLGYTRILAPVPGTIASVSTNEGETVAASFAAPTFVSIVDLDRLEVRAYVDETDIGRIEVGQPATFSVDAYPGRELGGVVTALHPKAEVVNSVVNYVAIVSIAEGDVELLRPEMTAHVRFVLERRDAALTVPRSALLRENGTSFVIEAGEAGWRRSAVETGLFTTRHVEITAGVGEGAVVTANARAWSDAGREASP